ERPMAPVTMGGSKPPRIHGSAVPPGTLRVNFFTWFAGPRDPRGLFDRQSNNPVTNRTRSFGDAVRNVQYENVFACSRAPALGRIPGRAARSVRSGYFLVPTGPSCYHASCGGRLFAERCPRREWSRGR